MEKARTIEYQLKIQCFFQMFWNSGQLIINIFIIMSEMDLNDPFMGKEFAISQLDNSLDQDLSVPDLLNNRTSCDSNQEFTNAYQFNYHDYRHSETPINHQQESINNSSNRFFIQPKLNKPTVNFNVKNQTQLQTIGENEQFECKCHRNIRYNCAFCNGEGKIKGGNNLIKFFEYVIAFKMGKQESYSKKKLNSFKKETKINNFCSQFYNDSKETQSNLSIRSTTRPQRQPNPKKCSKSQIEYELSTSLTIHSNFMCDKCGSSPIIGNRFHCNFCEDYDECNSCFQNSNHEHQLQKIDKCGRNRQMETMFRLGGGSIKPNSSLKPPPAIKRMFQSFGVATKSAVG